MAEDDDDWVLLMKCRGQPEAQVVRGRLESEGIAVELEDESSNSLMMFLGTSTEIRVFVLGGTLDQSLAILREAAGDQDANEIDEEADEPPDEPKLWLGAVLGLGVCGLSLGLGQFYVGRRKLGLVMLAVAAISLYAWLALDSVLAAGVLVEIWAADVLLASWTIILRNREIAARKQARLARVAGKA